MLDNIKYEGKNHQPQTNKTDHQKVWTHSLILILKAILQKEIEQSTPSLVRWADLIPQKETKQATPSLIRPQANLFPQTAIKRATPSLVGPQADSFPQMEIEWATPSSAGPQAIERATPSSVWPQANLILPLQNIKATPCPHLSKPLFKFGLSVKAAEMNFILLTHKFGRILHLALHTQNGLPLLYGSKFKPASSYHTAPNSNRPQHSSSSSNFIWAGRWWKQY